LATITSSQPAGQIKELTPQPRKSHDGGPSFETNLSSKNLFLKLRYNVFVFEKFVTIRSRTIAIVVGEVHAHGKPAVVHVDSHAGGIPFR
jgi:hypothetical protein